MHFACSFADRPASLHLLAAMSSLAQWPWFDSGTLERFSLPIPPCPPPGPGNPLHTIERERMHCPSGHSAIPPNRSFFFRDLMFFFRDHRCGECASAQLQRAALPRRQRVRNPRGGGFGLKGLGGAESGSLAPPNALSLDVDLRGAAVG